MSKIGRLNALRAQTTAQSQTLLSTAARFFSLLSLGMATACGGGNESDNAESVRLDQPMTLSANAVAPGEAVSYRAYCSGSSRISYLWDPGDGTGTYVTESNTSTHVYKKLGSVIARVSCQGFRGAKVDSSAYLLVGYPQISMDSIKTIVTRSADFTEVIFDGACLSDVPDSKFSYSWDFGDGSNVAEGKTVTHRYRQKASVAGWSEYTASFLCQISFPHQDDAGNPVTLSQSVSGKNIVEVGLVNTALKITQPLKITADQENHRVQVDMACANTNSNGNPVGYTFNFGDDTLPVSSTTGNASHQYHHESGFYQISGWCSAWNGDRSQGTGQVLPLVMNNAFKPSLPKPPPSTSN